MDTNMDSQPSTSKQLEYQVEVDPPSLLLPEILGFSPQLLLDDIVDAANEVQSQIVEGMDSFLVRWADDRAKNTQNDTKDEWDTTEEVESGIISFQTLLQEHTDIAFDLFEVWTLRNIFSTNVAGYPDLEKYIVARNHEELDLDQRPGREEELVEEFKALRDRVQMQRQQKRAYKLALIKAKIRHRRAQALSQKMSFIDNPLIDQLLTIPAQLHELCSLVQELPRTDPVQFAAALKSSTEPGKRAWETSETGYMNWAVGQLIERVRPGQGVGTPGIERLYEEAKRTGETADLRALLQQEEQEGSLS